MMSLIQSEMTNYALAYRLLEGMDRTTVKSGRDYSNSAASIVNVGGEELMENKTYFSGGDEAGFQDSHMCHFDCSCPSLRCFLGKAFCRGISPCTLPPASLI